MQKLLCGFGRVRICEMPPGETGIQPFHVFPRRHYSLQFIGTEARLM